MSESEIQDSILETETCSGNLAIVAAAQVASLGHSDLNALFKAAKMPTISEAHFLRLSKWYVWPKVEDAYAMKQARKPSRIHRYCDRRSIR